MKNIANLRFAARFTRREFAMFHCFTTASRCSETRAKREAASRWEPPYVVGGPVKHDAVKQRSRFGVGFSWFLQKIADKPTPGDFAKFCAVQRAAPRARKAWSSAAKVQR